jgi:hypothetical protein
LPTSKRNPRLFLRAYHFSPIGLDRSFAGIVPGSPMTWKTYGGPIGWAFTRIPMPTFRKALRTVRRCPFTLIASAPAAHSASVRRVRSESRTSWLPALSGALFTVTWIPGPFTAPKPVRTPSLWIRACAASSSVLSWFVRLWRASTCESARWICCWRSVRPSRRRLICWIRLSRLALDAEALRLVCTAATVTRSPNASSTSPAVRRGTWWVRGALPSARRRAATCS